MKVDAAITFELNKAAKAAAEHEAAGYDGIWSTETSHDPFLPLLLASQTTTKVDLGTSITVAFARSPMTTAVTANDLQLASNGRFILGLGSQIKPHIEKRFSMPWSHPAPRMREFVLAMRAIWSCWNERTKLDFRGEFYSHTLMTPYFDPGPNPHGAPRVYLAGVGPQMTEVAGEVCDGFLCHGFTTERYLREVTMPALARGRAKAGKTMEGFEVTGPTFIVTGDNEDQREKADQATRQQLAFYGSTPAYKSVLEVHGWSGLQEELNLLSKQGQWVEMGKLISDEMLEAFAIVGAPEQIAPAVQRRYGDILSRVSLYSSNKSEPPRWGPVMEALKGSP
jgi:probable F420-dependent oxidoreductase